MRSGVPGAILMSLAVGVGVVALHDAATPVSREWSTRALAGAIEDYRQHVSPRLRPVIRCRFKPSCSAYGLASVNKHGAVRGSWKAISRIARCNPRTKPGTVDLP